jgi:arylformamidase
MSRKLTPEQIREINRQYLPRLSIPDADNYLAKSEVRSRRVRRSMDAVLDVSYGPRKRQVMDIFPANSPGSPVLVFIHGGYWRAQNIGIRTYSHIAKPFVAAGAAVVIPEYDLCPDVRVTDIVAQMQAALKWVHANIKRYNGARSAITVSGHSAGGHLTAMLVATDWKRDFGLTNRLIKSSAPLSGLFDIEPHRHSDLQADIRLSTSEARALSPMHLAPISTGPVLAAVGGAESDRFHWQSLQYAANLRTHGVAAEVVSTPGDHHFSITDRLGNGRDQLTRQLLGLMGL